MKRPLKIDPFNQLFDKIVLQFYQSEAVGKRMSAKSSGINQRFMPVKAKKAVRFFKRFYLKYGRVHSVARHSTFLESDQKSSIFSDLFSKKILLSLFLLSACAPTISNFDRYEKQLLPESAFLPTKENLTGELPKIVVFDFNENSNEVAARANLGKSLAVNVENVLTKNRLAQLIDRSVAKKLEQEILLSQTSDKAPIYNGPAIANYAVSGTISNALFDKKYTAGALLYSKERGAYKTPPKFNYSSEVMGNVKVFEIPSMNVIENFEFSGYSSRSENVQKDNGFSIGGIVEIGVESAKGLERDDGLVRKAGESAIDDVSVAIKNAFAKKGYILEKRSLKKKIIFKISVGSDDGIEHGDKFEVFGKFEDENPITHEVEIENRLLGTGRVSDIINPKFSFVVLDEKDNNDKIRLGDVVKFKYKKNFSQNFSKLNRYIPN